MKDWMHMFFNRREGKGLSQHLIKGFIVLEAYDDAPTNSKFLKICMDTISVLFNYGKEKLLVLRNNLKNSGVKSHGLLNKPSNRKLNQQEKIQRNQQGSKHIF